MITHGHHPCPQALRRAASAVADESFTRSYPFTLADLPAAPEGWIYQLSTATMVKLKGFCEPHTDPYVGPEIGICAPGEVEPDHRSLFWLLKDTSKRSSHLMAENRSLAMAVDDWAFFDSRELHAFLADGTWVGMTIQLTRQPPETGAEV